MLGDGSLFSTLTAPSFSIASESSVVSLLVVSGLLSKLVLELRCSRHLRRDSSRSLSNAATGSIADGASSPNPTILISRLLDCRCLLLVGELMSLRLVDCEARWGTAGDDCTPRFSGDKCVDLVVA